MQYLIFAYATPEVVATQVARIQGMESPEHISNGYRLSVRRSVGSIDVRKNLDAKLRDEPSIRLLSKRMGGPAQTVVEVDMDPDRSQVLMAQLEERLKLYGIPYFSGVRTLTMFEFKDVHHPYN